jgi:hypothetical protein
MDTTIVSSFIYLENNKSRSLDEYINNGIKFLEQNVPKIIFMDEKLINLFKKFENEITTIIPDKLENTYLYIHKDKVNIDIITDNPTKDTFEYFIIMNNKTEWIKRAIELNIYNTENFIWIDFGIHHIINNNINFSDYLLNKNYNKIRIASIWNMSLIVNIDITKSIFWFFCGGIFGGNKVNLIKFSELVKNKCLYYLENNILFWEVNIWYLIYLENKELFDFYYVNHDERMITHY